MNRIWLSEKDYPDFQKNFVNINETPEEKRSAYNYCVAEFKKTNAGYSALLCPLSFKREKTVGTFHEYGMKIISRICGDLILRK